MTDPVLYSLEDSTATLTLNHPDQLNALGDDLVSGINAGMDKAAADNARLIVFKAAGRGFSGGLDLSDLETASDGDLLLRLVRIEQFLQRIRHAPIATLALVHGACYGAAADLVLCCRTRVATEDARFLMPGLRFGIVLGTRRLRDVLGEPAAYFLLDRVKPFTAADALNHGFLTEIVEADLWPDSVTSAAMQVSGFSAEAYAHRVASLTPDTRADDMTALVNSIATDTNGASIKTRLQTYVVQIKAARDSRRKTS